MGEQWGTTFLGVPYKGGPQIFTALTAGEIDVTWQGVYGAIGLMKAKKLKLLAVGGSKRLALYPDVPTLRELGLGDLPSAQAWWGLLTQAAVPDPVVRRLNAEFVRTFRDPKFLEYLDSQVTESSVGTPEEFGALIRSSREKLGVLINRYNIPKQ